MRDERGWSESTARQYAARVRAADRWMRQQGWAGVDRARPEHVRAWWEQLPATPSSRNIAAKALGAHGEWLVATGRRRENPAKDLPSWRERRGVPRPVPEDDARRIAAMAVEGGGQWWTGVALMLMCGLRVSEASALPWSAVEPGWVTVNGKGGHSRRVPVPDPLQRMLVRWRVACPSNRWVLPGTTGHVHAETLRRHTVELTGYTPHMYRHQYATALYEATGDLLLVQRALGHASPQTSAIYAQVSPQRLADGVRGLWAA